MPIIGKCVSQVGSPTLGCGKPIYGKCVYYSGVNLCNTGIRVNDTIDVCLSKIDTTFEKVPRQLPFIVGTADSPDAGSSTWQHDDLEGATILYIIMGGTVFMGFGSVLYPVQFAFDDITGTIDFSPGTWELGVPGIVVYTGAC